MRSNGRMPGLAPSQLQAAKETASYSGGAHLLIFHGREKSEEDMITADVVPYFRLRWLDRTLVKLIPHQIDDLFEAINSILCEELEWTETVRPRDLSCCLLLPECAFSAAPTVRHIWTAATEAGIERIKLAARASERFGNLHWLPRKNSARGWIDTDGRIFDHRGALHGIAPFPWSWKFSYQMVDGFHYDVTSRDSRIFKISGADGSRHPALASGHINIDPHGHVRP